MANEINKNGIEPQPNGEFAIVGDFIRSARKSNPAFRYVTAVAGIAAIIVAFARFGTDFVTLAFGSVVIIVLTVVFLLFPNSRPQNLASSCLGEYCSGLDYFQA